MQIFLPNKICSIWHFFKFSCLALWLYGCQVYSLIFQERLAVLCWIRFMSCPMSNYAILGVAVGPLCHGRRLSDRSLPAGDGAVETNNVGGAVGAFGAINVSGGG